MISIASGKILIEKITIKCESLGISSDEIRDLDFAQGYFMALFERDLGDQQIIKLFEKYGVNI